jgi:alkyl hydroperoxide reductase subunit AhpC
LIADVTKEISTKYGVLNDGGISFRGTFIIDDNQTVKHLSVNDLPVGRNVDEYLRLVKVKYFIYLGLPIHSQAWRSLSCFMDPRSQNHESWTKR